jgi:hypothetical protein
MYSVFSTALLFIGNWLLREHKLKHKSLTLFLQAAQFKTQSHNSYVLRYNNLIRIKSTQM